MKSANRTAMLWTWLHYHVNIPLVLSNQQDPVYQICTSNNSKKSETLQYNLNFNGEREIKITVKNIQFWRTAWTHLTSAELQGQHNQQGIFQKYCVEVVVCWLVCLCVYTSVCKCVCAVCPSGVLRAGWLPCRAQSLCLAKHNHTTSALLTWPTEQGRESERRDPTWTYVCVCVCVSVCVRECLCVLQARQKAAPSVLLSQGL